MLQSSVEYLHIPVTGADAATLSAGMLAVSFTGPTGTYVPVDAYTYDATAKTGTAKLLVGPGTTAGQFPTGPAQLYLRINAAPETVVVRADPGPYIEAA